MMQGKSLLNPYAAPFIPCPKNFPGVSFEGDDKALLKTVGISDNSEDAAMAGRFQLTGSASVQNIQPIQKLHLSDKLVSEMDQCCFSDEENEIMNNLDYLMTMFPNYSTDSMMELLNANQCDLRETIDALEQLEYNGDVSQEFPEVHNNFVLLPCQKSDSARPSSST